MKKLKQLFSFLLAVCLLLGCLPLAASAALTIPTSTRDYTYDDSSKTLTIKTNENISMDWGADPPPWLQAKWPIEHVVIQNGVTEVGMATFCGCTSLTSVTFPSTVIRIGGQAFADCTALAAVQLPSGLTEIGWGAFSNCTLLTSVNLSAGLTDLAGNAFSGCSSLTSISIPEASTTYKSENGVLFTKDGTELVMYPAGKSGAHTIPDSVTTIGESALSGSSLTSITIPATVSNIGSSAFSGCEDLTEVTLADGITGDFKNEYGDPSDGLFSGCPNLTTIHLPDSLTVIGSWFSNCTGLTNIDFLPETVTDLNGTFSGCTGLTSITLPNSLTTVRNGAFEDCTNLVSVTLPNSLKTIEWSSFANCTALTSITLPDSLTELSGGCFEGCTGLTSITLPENLEKLGGGAFMGTKITSIHIPAKTSLLHNWWSGLYGPFYDCDTLTTVTVDEDNLNYKVVDGVLFSKDGKDLVYYPAGKTDTSYTIPDGVVSIGVEVDTKVVSNHHSRENITNANLTSITFPESVTETGGITFYSNTSLETVYGVAGSAIDTAVQSYNEYADNKITFKNIPAKPVMRVSSNKEKLTVSWNAPAADNVTGYTLTITDGDQFSKTETLGAVTSHVFEELTNGTKYTLTLTAQNANGSSYTATATGTPRTPSAPSGGSSDPEPEEPVVTTNPDGSETATETAEDGTVTATTTWDDGKQAVSVKTPEGEKTITVTTASGEKVADVNIPAKPDAGKKFKDVKSGAWYESAVETATGYKLFGGTSDTKFGPDESMTRGMLATVLHNLSGNPQYGTDSSVFDDVKTGIWYENPVDWAYKAGIVGGTGNNSFSPNKSITREELVTMLYNYAGKIGSSSKKRTQLAGFPDANKVTGYAQTPMQWAVAEGFISGRAEGGKNYIAPKATATRAEVAAVLTKFVEYLKK